jgi:hypothetical protein
MLIDLILDSPVDKPLNILSQLKLALQLLLPFRLQLFQILVSLAFEVHL